MLSGKVVSSIIGAVILAIIAVVGGKKLRKNRKISVTSMSFSSNQKQKLEDGKLTDAILVDPEIDIYKEGKEYPVTSKQTGKPWDFKVKVISIEKMALSEMPVTSSRLKSFAKRNKMHLDKIGEFVTFETIPC